MHCFLSYCTCLPSFTRDNTSADNIGTDQTILNSMLSLHILNNMCEISFDLEWNIQSPISVTGAWVKKIHVIYAPKFGIEDTFPVVHFHASQVG